MTEESTYNGWSNRETWLAGLWLDNDEYFQTLLLEACRRSTTNFERADWLGIWFWNQTFDVEVECDIEEIRQLFDDESSGDSIPASAEGEV